MYRYVSMPLAGVLVGLLLLSPEALYAQSLYNVNSGDQTITEIDLYTGALLHTIPTPVPTHVPAAGGPEGLAFDGTYLYFVSGNASLEGAAVVENRTVYVLDPASGATIRTIVLPAASSSGEREQAIDGLAYGRYGGVPTLFANRPSSQQVFLIDLRSDTIYGTLSHTGYAGIGGMGFSTYRQTLYLSESDTQTLHEIDPATGTSLNSLTISPDGGMLGVDFVENKLFVAANHSREIIELSPETGVEINRFSAPTIYPSALAGSPGTITEDPDCDADLLFVVNSSTSTYSLLDPNTGVEQARFLTPLPTYPPGSPGTLGGPEGLAFDGSVLYYVSGDAPDGVRAETIYTVDPCTGTVLGTLTPTFPATTGDPTIDALAYGTPGGTPTLYAMRPDGNTIYTIDPSTGALTGSLTAGSNVIGGLGYDNSRSILWASDFNASPNMMHELDPNTGAVASSFSLPDPHALGVDFVRDRLFVAMGSGTSGGGTATVTAQAAASGDDAEETLSSGTMNLNSPSLELGEDNFAGSGDAQMIGLRFDNVAVPQGATINRAFLRFTAAASTSAFTSLRIYGEATDDAPSFTTTNSDASSRTTSANIVGWVNVAAWTSGNTYDSPDLSNIVMDIVHRSGWASGQAMAFLINGSGHRDAVSFDASSTGAPQLIIEYATPTSTGTIIEYDASGTALNSFPAPDFMPSALAGPPAHPIMPVGLRIDLTPRRATIDTMCPTCFLVFDLALMNEAAADRTTQVWIDVDGPGVAVERGPVSVTVDAGATRSRRMRVRIPRGATEGSYTLRASVGDHPAAEDSDAFAFYVKAAAGHQSRGKGNDALGWEIDLSPLAEDATELPTAVALDQNYPNPFNPTTLIQYTLPEAAEVRLTVYNVLGQEVLRLFEGAQQAGIHAVRLDASRLSAGTYLYVLETPTSRLVSRMVLLK